MGLALERAVIETVDARVIAELAFVPHGQPHGERWEQGRLASAPTQPGAQTKSAVVVGQLESRRGAVIALVGGEVSQAADHARQRNQVAGVKQMIDAQGRFTAEAGEGFFRQELPLAHFDVIVRKSPAGQADAQVGVLAQGLADAQF